MTYIFWEERKNEKDQVYQRGRTNEKYIPSHSYDKMNGKEPIKKYEKELCEPKRHELKMLMGCDQLLCKQ